MEELFSTGNNSFDVGYAAHIIGQVSREATKLLTQVHLHFFMRQLSVEKIMERNYKPRPSVKVSGEEMIETISLF